MRSVAVVSVHTRPTFFYFFFFLFFLRSTQKVYCVFLFGDTHALKRTYFLHSVASILPQKTIDTLIRSFSLTRTHIRATQLIFCKKSKMPQTPHSSRAHVQFTLQTKTNSSSIFQSFHTHITDINHIDRTRTNLLHEIFDSILHMQTAFGFICSRKHVMNS